MARENPRPEISQLSAVMSLEFDDACSNTAQAANIHAEALLQKVRRVERLEVLVDPDVGGAFSEQFYTRDIGGTERKLKLIRPYGKPRRGADIGPNIQLVAMAENGLNLAVPIAGFARREGSGCSYVQIGDEIHDESYVITQRDERLPLVIAIKSLLKNEATPPQQSLLHSLVRERVDRYQKKIIEELPRALTHKVFQRFHMLRPKEFDELRLKTRARGEPYSGSHYSKIHTVLLPSKVLPEGIGIYASEKKMWLLGEKEEKQSVLANYLPQGNVVLNDGRPAQIVFLRECEYGNRIPGLLPKGMHIPTGDKAMLAAVTRGAVALPLASFDITDGNVEVYLPDGSRETADQATIEDIYQLLTHPVDETWSRLEKVAQESIPYQPGIIGRANIRRKQRKGYMDSRSVLRVEDFGYSTFVVQTYVGDIHTLYDEVSKRAMTDNPAVPSFLERLDVARQFREHLGQYREAEEKLLKTLGFLAARGTEFSGHLKDVPLGGDEIGDTDIVLRLDESSKGYSVWIGGRLTVSKHPHNKKVYNVDINPARTIELKDHEVAEILQLLGALSVHKTSRQQ